jgi:hypothetical protein
MPAGVTQRPAPLASRDCYDTDRRLSKTQTPSKFKKKTERLHYRNINKHFRSNSLWCFQMPYFFKITIGHDLFPPVQLNRASIGIFILLYAYSNCKILHIAKNNLLKNVTFIM